MSNDVTEPDFTEPSFTEPGFTEPSVAAVPVAPIEESRRISAIDALRGFAILGIFLVNISGFCGPIIDYLVITNPFATMSGSDRIVWGLIRVLAEYKFVSTFSLLFGVGLVVQMTRMEARGQAFGGLYLRRLLFLAGFGLLHLLFLWWGDILLLYAGVGVVAFFFRKASPRTLAIVGAALIGLSVLILGGFTTLGAAMGQLGATSITAVEPADSDAAADSEDSTDNDALATDAVPAEGADEEDAVPVEEVEAPLDDDAELDDERPPLGSWDRFAEEVERASNAEDPRAWREAELIAYRDGPLLATVAARAATYTVVMILASLIQGFGFRLLGLFLIGMALMKVSFFDPRHRAWHRRMAIWGLLLGIPGEALAISGGFLSGPDEITWRMAFGETLHLMTSLVLCFGYVGTITLIANGGHRWIVGSLAAVGRMALTNYILQSVIATFLMTWIGLRLFGEVDRLGQMGIVVGVYLAQLVASVLWLRLFVMGPLEWIWRTLSYGRAPALRRRD